MLSIVKIAPSWQDYHVKVLTNLPSLRNQTIIKKKKKEESEVGCETAVIPSISAERLSSFLLLCASCACIKISQERILRKEKVFKFKTCVYFTLLPIMIEFA